jgi:hypothetical protein
LGASYGLLIKGLLDQHIELVPEDLKDRALGIAKEVSMATQAATSTLKEGGNKSTTSHDWEEMRKLVVGEADKAAASAVKELLSKVKKTSEQEPLGAL